MNQIQIQIIQPQIFQRSLDCLLRAFIAGVLHPQFGSNEQFLPGNAAFGNRLPDSGFVHVGSGCIDETVTAVYRVQHRFFTLPGVRNLKNSESFLRHFYSIIQCYIFHFQYIPKFIIPVFCPYFTACR